MQGMWWARFAVVACTGLFRAGMLAMGPLLWDRGVGEEQRRGGAEEGAASHLLLRLSPRAMQLQGR